MPSVQKSYCANGSLCPSRVTRKGEEDRIIYRKILIKGTIENGTREVTPFYVFYYNIEANIQNKLQQGIVNPFLIAEIREENKKPESREYEEDTTFLKAEEGKDVPPQLRDGIMKKVN
ncbi:unnamed protein product [Meloidogyne enterolobii]|uniref:Uncharacterized protein n=1 Tax=Meloidogyne enterolobii TaxID=390850 RepID=A0ACB0XXC2_MELEN